MLLVRLGRSSKPWLPTGLLTHSCTRPVTLKLTVLPGAALTLAVARRVVVRSPVPLAPGAVYATSLLAWFWVLWLIPDDRPVSGISAAVKPDCVATGQLDGKANTL